MSRPIEKLFLLGVTAAFVGVTAYGVSLATEPAATAKPVATCERQQLAEGEELTSNLVTVAVYNASDRAGLAATVRTSMINRGFMVDTVGNSPSKVVPTNIAILVNDKDDPRAKLIAEQFKGDIEYAPSDIDTKPGVIPILIGQDIAGGVDKAPTSLKLEKSITVCVPGLPPVDN